MAESCIKYGQAVDRLENGTIIRQARPEPEKQPKRLKTHSARFILQTEFSELVAPVENLIAEGLSLLCGASKIGKSWFVLSMCCAVASGRPFLGRKTDAGGVLYLALEDSERRLRKRMIALGESLDENLDFATEASTLENGLLEELADWVAHSDSPRMIVIDTLQKIRGAAPSRANAYALDYEAMGRLKRFADQQHIAVVLVHHLNKMRDVVDPFDKISGSTGLMGAADTTILIDRKRGENDATLSFTGRDVFGEDIHLRMNDGQWSVIGQEAAEREAYEANPIVQTVRALLNESFGGVVNMSLDNFREAVAKHTGTCAAATREKLGRMVNAVAPSLRRFDGVILDRPRRAIRLARVEKGA